MTSADAENNGEQVDPDRSKLNPATDEGTSTDAIVVDKWAGGIDQNMASIPSIRLGRKWISVGWFAAISVVLLLVLIAVAQQLLTYDWMQNFLVEYPGTATTYAPAVTDGFPAWLRWQHLFNIVFMMFIIRAGLQIFADHPRLYLDGGSRPGSEWLRMRGPVPADRMDPADPVNVWTAKDDSVALPANVGLPGFRHSIGLARWWHFSFDLFWLINGIVFYILLFSTGQWQRIVPVSWDVVPNAISTMVQYLSLDLPANEGFTNYNGLQLLAYFLTIFVAAPLAFITGLLQSPAVAAKFGLAKGVLNRQVARSIHFAVLSWMVFFIAVHTVMIFITGLIPNLNHITLGTNTDSWWALAIYLIAMVVIVGLWLAASPFTKKHPRRVQRIGTLLVGRIKWLMEWWNPKKQYKESDISPYLWPNGEIPPAEVYDALKQDDFAAYRLRVDGLVANPKEFTLAELRAMPQREQITQHYCIQGWSGIAKWSGVAMSDILDLVEPSQEAKWVVFYSFADGPVGGRYYDCHSIENMRHEQTILAYGMNGEPLSETHGAPIRLRDEVELGFKQVKWVEAIEFVRDFDDIGGGHGGYNEDHEFFGYRMPI